MHKSKAYLFPAEFIALVSCEAIPAPWRWMYAVTTYLYLRAAEARALEWADIDLERGVVLIHRTEDEEGRYGAGRGFAGASVAPTISSVGRCT